MSPAVALFSRLLLPSSSSFVSSSSSSTTVFISLWYLVRLVLVVVFLFVVEVVSGREPGCWAGKGLGEGAGKEQ